MSEFNWLDLINPEFYINISINGIKVGLFVVLFIVYAETGLFAGFFLPGDSLLFLSGIYSRELIENFMLIESDFLNVLLLATMVAVAGILGNMTGYWFGKKSGYYLYNREDTFWFKKKYLHQSRDFFEKHGGRAIILARFLPIFRTFAPIVAGIVHMDKKRFMLFNVLSSFVWSFSLIFAGHYLYGFCLDAFGINLKDYIGVIIIFLVAITTIPVVLKLLKAKDVPADNSAE